MLKLWYEKEAEIWEEALPLGNGRIGAMVFSGVKTERISLNEDTLWSGCSHAHDRHGASEHYFAARELALRGEYKEAQEIIEAHLLGEDCQKYLPLGDLLIETNETGETITCYRRELDLTTALSKLTYNKGDATFSRETFVSAPDQALVTRLRADRRFDLTVRLVSQLSHKLAVRENALILEGICDNAEEEPRRQGISFIAIAAVEASNGAIECKGNALFIKSADDVIIRFCCRSNFAGAFTPPALGGVPYRENVEEDMRAALALDYDALKARHIADHQALFNRVELSFGRGNDHLPIPQRLENREENDRSIFALLFQYGRYLMIAGSRSGTRPLNLQGIWNARMDPPWNSNYTLNINAEMNYWPAEPTNLSECHEPLFGFTNDLRTNGANTARIYYGANGFAAHHNSDIWAMSTPVRSWNAPGVARWGFWSMGAGWLSAHAFSHYEYTQDADFLRNTALPIIKDAALFYLDVLTEDADGALIFAPSTSPENDFICKDGVCAVSKTTTMTTAIIRETLTNAVTCCEILDTEPQFKSQAQAALDRLPEYKTGSRGELLEWSEEYAEYEPTHRHTSHLYPLYPGNEILPETPLADACAKTLELRGPEGTGWALAWRICLWARLLDGEKAFGFLEKQLRLCDDRQGGCYPNLFGSHPPFQIDSNFGACAGIAETLLQSRKAGHLRLLPALPKALSDGYVKGLRGKGGVTVNIWFESGRVKKAELTLDKRLSANTFIVDYNGEHRTLRLEPGEVAVIT